MNLKKDNCLNEGRRSGHEKSGLSVIDLVNRPEPQAYDSLSEFEKARFDRQIRLQFDVSRKKRRLAKIRELPKLRRSNKVVVLIQDSQRIDA